MRMGWRGGMLGGMSRLRRLVLSDRFFFITCRVHASRGELSGAELAVLADAIQGRRTALQFLLTAWAFLPDHWHAIIFPRSPLTISQAMAAVKVSWTLLISGRR